MRPESLPKAYEEFIQKTGPVGKPVYKAIRDSCRGSLMDIEALSDYLSKKVPGPIKLDEFSSIIPCSVIHPNTNSCLVQNGKATLATFKKTFLLYFSLTFVPFVVLRLQKVNYFVFNVFICHIEVIISTNFVLVFLFFNFFRVCMWVWETSKANIFELQIQINLKLYKRFMLWQFFLRLTRDCYLLSNMRSRDCYLLWIRSSCVSFRSVIDIYIYFGISFLVTEACTVIVFYYLG